MADLGRFQFTAVDEAGNVLPLASVEVRSEASGLLASLFSNRTGTTPIANPFTATSEGFAAFHVDGGAYKITATLGADSREWRYVPIGTAAERDLADIYDNAALTGTPTAPTAALGTDTTQIATMAALMDVYQLVTGSVDSPFDTLGELSTLKANIVSPTFTGIPAAPTAAPGNNSTQLATTAYVDNVAAGAMVLIQSQTASASSTIDFATGLNDTYDEYFITMSSIKMSVDDSVLQLRVGTGGGPTYQATGYNYIGSSVGGATTNNGTAQTQINLNRSGAGVGIGNASGESFSGNVRFSNPEASDFMMIMFDTNHARADATGPERMVGSGCWLTAGAVTAIRFLPSTGNITSGRFTLYGLKKA